jgi:hypothetical protein
MHKAKAFLRDTSTGIAGGFLNIKTTPRRLAGSCLIKYSIMLSEQVFRLLCAGH